MPRYFIELAYHGKNYHGFARQTEGNPITIQGEVERVLEILLRESIVTTTSSRTDAHVHGRQNFLHFDTDLPLLHNLVYKMNAILEDDILVRNIYQCDGHSRFDATSREYHYHIHTIKNPFITETSWFFPYRIDATKLLTTAEIIGRQSDFIAFTKKHGQSETYDCHITKSHWEMSKGQMLYIVESNRFLRGMVRALVSTQLQVALGNISIEGFEQFFQNAKIASADFGAPGHGLTLMHVNFPDQFLGEPILDSIDRSKV